jgi:gamma-D-glutamyl-L-lysine dipeptidyl-peptidase
LNYVYKTGPMKSSEYKRLILPLILFSAILSAIFSCRNTTELSYQTEIDSIAERWVPDSRMGICTITAAKGKEGVLILKGETTSPDARIEIIKTLNDQGIKLIDSILILPDTTENKKFMGLVSISVINMRKQPDHKSELVSQAIMGTPVLILKNGNSWVLIQTPDKYIAWTEKSSVALMDQAEMNSWKKSDRLIFMDNTGWVYSSPDEKGVVSDIVAGSILKKTGESHGYIKAAFPDGREGYIRSSNVMDFKSWESHVQCTGDNVCKTASSLLGIPYLWGGTSSKGVDCSGFVQSVFFMNGIILQRDASLQAMYGSDVDISNGFSLLKRGDLLFFGTKDNKNQHVTHVAIFIGNSEYINSSGRVVINSLDSSRTNFVNYRIVSLLKAKRMIGIEDDKGIVPVLRHEWY